MPLVLVVEFVILECKSSAFVQKNQVFSKKGGEIFVQKVKKTYLCTRETTKSSSNTESPDYESRQSWLMQLAARSQIVYLRGTPCRKHN